MPRRTGLSASINGTADFDRAEAWRWSSLWRRMAGGREQQEVLSTWPVARPRDRCKWVNEPQTESEVEAIRRCVQRGRPLARP
jgi:putative transposase